MIRKIQSIFTKKNLPLFLICFLFFLTTLFYYLFSLNRNLIFGILFLVLSFGFLLLRITYSFSKTIKIKNGPIFLIELSVLLLLSIIFAIYFLFMNSFSLELNANPFFDIFFVLFMLFILLFDFISGEYKYVR